MTFEKKSISRQDGIEYLDLSLRTYNQLRRAGIDTIKDLLNAINENQIQDIRGIGIKSYDEIINQIKNFKIIDDSIRQSDMQKNNKQNPESNNLNIGLYCQLTSKTYEDAISDQQQLIQKQILYGLLHPKVLIFEKTLGDIISRQGEDIVEFKSSFSIILNSFSISEELAELTDQISFRSLSIFLLRYGFVRKTLKEISINYEVTRERVRQICSRVETRVISRANRKTEKRVGRIPFVRMQTGLLLAEEMGNEITFNKWEGLLVRSGLLGNVKVSNIEDKNILEFYWAICNLFSQNKIKGFTIPENLRCAVDLLIQNKPDVPAKDILVLQDLQKSISKTIFRHLRYSGSVNAKWLADDVHLPIQELEDILVAYDFINVERDWFIRKRKNKNEELNVNEVFEHALRKMTQYCGPLSIEEICSGLRHAVSRTSFPVPPPKVMVEILNIRGYIQEDQLWYWNGEIDEETNGGEDIILNCLREYGPVIHHSEIAQAFIESDYSFPAMHGTLRKSPIFEKIDYALYKLRGEKISYEDIDRARNEGDRIPVDLEVRPLITGEIQVFGSLGVLSVGTGVFYSENLPNLTGVWNCFVNKTQYADIEAMESEIHGLLKPIENLQCKIGDRICMTFNTWNRSVKIDKVDDD